MKRFTLLVYFISTSLFGQDIRNAEWIAQDTTKVSLKAVAYWKQGEKRQYELKKSLNNFIGDSLINEKINTHFVIEIQVLDSAADHYKLKWTVKENKKKLPLGFDKLDLDYSILLHNLITEYSLIYWTDEWGTFEKYEEDPTLDAFSQEVFHKAVKYTLDTSSRLSEPEKMKTYDFMKSLYTPERIREATLGDAITVFHYFFGYESGLDDTLKFEETMEVPQFKSGIDLESYFYISSYDPETAECQYSFSKYGDGEQAKKLSLEVLGQLNNSMDKIDQEINQLEMSYNLYSESYIDLNTGWPTQVEYYREIGIVKDNQQKIRQETILIIPVNE